MIQTGADKPKHMGKGMERERYDNDINHGKVTVESNTWTERDEWIEKDEYIDRYDRLR